MFNILRRKTPEIDKIVKSHYVGDDTILLTSEQEFIYLDGRYASITPSMLRFGMWEPEIWAFLVKNLRGSDCYIDIGANVGLHVLHAAKLVGSEGLVVAFEPQERLLRINERSICANLWHDRVILRRMAIGEYEGVAKLGKFAHFNGSATLTQNMAIVDREEVPLAPLAIALGQVANEIGREIRPDIIKIDVEGFEFDVWNGMRDWSRDIDRLLIVLEYSPVSYRDMGRNPLELLKDFVAFGFTISHLTADGDTKACSPDEWPELADSRRQFNLVLAKGHTD